MDEKIRRQFSCPHTGNQYVTMLTDKEYKIIISQKLRLEDLDEAVSNLPKAEQVKVKKITKFKKSVK